MGQSRMRVGYASVVRADEKIERTKPEAEMRSAVEFQKVREWLCKD